MGINGKKLEHGIQMGLLIDTCTVVNKIHFQTAVLL